MRIKRGKTTRRRHKKILKLAKGYRTIRKSNVKVARTAIMKALSYAYRDRRNKKRVFRSLWVSRINAGLESFGVNYSRFIKALKDKKIDIDRKILAKLAAEHPEIFKRIVEHVAK
ncbi:50S ribosomal protein L20 [candidate division Kazan bacterium]|uniref:Large ribosomal subunit protein bL20 n=1 Tax=candidate division Kazan bacterium TaxID=2202143 RepID=A0A420ZD55_UNCK3|nr:MAG: 50S ribosomal protein L20 [candidate division Kazan bacterium]